ncbi:MAG: hypothetical protein CM15mP74_16800 [Halieaceae bacterium]|nr:MAG: hypothetical protein CM15mP74_16800 [Halieaceae bacterium]
MQANGTDEPAQDVLMRSGMLVKNDKGRTYDRFRERVMFPIQDQRGRVIAFGGRVLGDDKPKYLNSPRRRYSKSPGTLRPLAGPQASTQVGAHCGRRGLHGRIAWRSMAFITRSRPGHLHQRNPPRATLRLVPEVVFCFDGDDAGRKAAFRGSRQRSAMQDGRQAKFLFLPEGEDPDTLVRAKGKAYLENLFDHADPLETFLFKHLAEGLDLESMDGRARFSKLAAPHLHRFRKGFSKP